MNALSSLRLGNAAASLAASVLFAAVAAPASAAGGCSVDDFSIADAPVKVTLCPGPLKTAANGATSVAVAESIASGDRSFTRSSQLDFFDGETTSRSIDDIDLAKVGIAKTLHITIDYKAGAVHIEHALLVPGAITLK